MTVPLGHWQRGTHCLVQIGAGLVQLAGGQAEAQDVKTWPFTGHTAMQVLYHNLGVH